MKIILKTGPDLEAMRPTCAVASMVLEEVAVFIRPGVTTHEVDYYAASRIKHYGARSAFFGYRKYPCNICISVNDEVVHGLANERRLQFGDIVSLDVGVVYNGFVGDTARTVAVGGCSLEAQRLMDVTERSLYVGIAQAVPGNRVSDISRAVQNYVDSKAKDYRLQPGMTLAIEPMVNAGGPAVKILKDGWTAVTQDGSLSAHFEHSVLITGSEPDILTCLQKVPSKLKVG